MGQLPILIKENRRKIEISRLEASVIMSNHYLTKR